MNELSLFNTLFNDDGYGFPTFHTERARVPSVDVIENNSGYVIMMDLPGRTEKDVEISLKDDVLTIASVKQAKPKDNGRAEDNAESKADSNSDSGVKNYLIRERYAYDFQRSFTMPKDINQDAVSATFKNGVLAITIERKPTAEKRKIAIQAA